MWQLRQTWSFVRFRGRCQSLYSRIDQPEHSGLKPWIAIFNGNNLDRDASLSNPDGPDSRQFTDNFQGAGAETPTLLHGTNITDVCGYTGTEASMAGGGTDDRV